MVKGFYSDSLGGTLLFSSLYCILTMRTWDAVANFYQKMSNINELRSTSVLKFCLLIQGITSNHYKIL